MNLHPRFFAAAGLAFAAFSAQADLFTDTTGDVAVPGAPYPHMDITGVTVTNTNSDLTFTIGLAGDPTVTKWGKYNIVMRTAGAVDTSSTGNGWGRNYALSGGANRFIGGWVDQTTDNSQLWAYTNGSWNQPGGQFSSVITSNSVSYTVSLASLGLAAGDSLVFDVATTGENGPNGAVDALSNPNPNIQGWDDASTLAGVTYNVAPVPEPASMMALSLGAAALLRKRKKSA